ncbi:MAG: FtsX-like permease family protein [Muribaculaceae bacterium]
MKRNLLSQMKNEWRENIWIIIELAVVGLAIWALLSMLFFMSEGLFVPRGFSPDNVYTITTKYISADSPNFVQTNDSTSKHYNDDFKTLLGRLRENPNVEAVAVHWGNIPYNYNYSGFQLNVVDEPDSVMYYGNRRPGSPDIVDVLELNSLTGATRQQLKEMLARGEILISDNEEYVNQGRDPFSLKGKTVTMDNDSSRVYRIGDVVEKVRRNDYEQSYAGCIIFPLSEDDRIWGDIILRVKDGKSSQFKSDFKNDASLRKLRNVYLTDLESLMDLREKNQRSTEVDIRLFWVVIGFLLLTIFLGLLGSFWFRMQQRVGEIALRKVCGATRIQIFRRIITEGMVLLLCAVVLVSASVWPFMQDVSDMFGREWYVFLIIEMIAFALVAFGILLSLWYPARKAMSVEPAIAIKDQ